MSARRMTTPRATHPIFSQSVTRSNSMALLLRQFEGERLLHDHGRRLSACPRSDVRPESPRPNGFLAQLSEDGKIFNDLHVLHAPGGRDREEKDHRSLDPELLR